MFEPGSGRTVNGPLYEMVRGELGLQWGRTKLCVSCTHTQVRPVCFEGSRPVSLQAVFTLGMCHLLRN